MKTCTVMRKGKELNRSIGSRSLHPFVQRLLVPSVRQQVAKAQVLMRSQQNCSKQEERRYWTECTEYVWRSGKLVSGQRNGRSPRSSHFIIIIIIIYSLKIGAGQQDRICGTYSCPQHKIKCRNIKYKRITENTITT